MKDENEIQRLRRLAKLSPGTTTCLDGLIDQIVELEKRIAKLEAEAS